MGQHPGTRLPEHMGQQDLPIEPGDFLGGICQDGLDGRGRSSGLQPAVFGVPTIGAQVDLAALRIIYHVGGVVLVAAVAAAEFESQVIIPQIIENLGVWGGGAIPNTQFFEIDPPCGDRPHSILVHTHGGQPVGFVAGGQLVDELVDGAFHHRRQVVRGDVDAVIGDARLGVVVGADFLSCAPPSRSANGGSNRSRRAVFLPRSRNSRARRMLMARILFCSCERSSWQATTMPVGWWVMRTAVEFFCTFCPPAPEERYTSISMSLSGMFTSTSSTSASTATVAVEVWMRPEDSVTGTRCTRCTPDLVFQARVRAAGL